MRLPDAARQAVAGRAAEPAHFTEVRLVQTKRRKRAKLSVVSRCLAHAYWWPVVGWPFGRLIPEPSSTPSSSVNRFRRERPVLLTQPIRMRRVGEADHCSAVPEDAELGCIEEEYAHFMPVLLPGREDGLLLRRLTRSTVVLISS